MEKLTRVFIFNIKQIEHNVSKEYYSYALDVNNDASSSLIEQVATLQATIDRNKVAVGSIIRAVKTVVEW